LILVWEGVGNSARSPDSIINDLIFITPDGSTSLNEIQGVVCVHTGTSDDLEYVRDRRKGLRQKERQQDDLEIHHRKDAFFREEVNPSVSGFVVSCLVLKPAKINTRHPAMFRISATAPWLVKKSVIPAASISTPEIYQRGVNRMSFPGRSSGSNMVSASAFGSECLYIGVSPRMPRARFRRIYEDCYRRIQELSPRPGALTLRKGTKFG
jgi:hypothetical protein